jgi:6,7-dimethyl-8-ribityllumazine synthase
LLAVNYKIAIGNGIITVENEFQALERASKNKRNKGGFAAKTCLEMIKIKNISC